MIVRPAKRRLARRLHPGAWWLWAIALAAAASRTTNPFVLLLLCAVAGLVVSLRRSDAPWARGFRYYLVLAAIIIGIRVVFRVFIGGQLGSTVMFRLPEIELPDVTAGITLGGPVTLEGVLAAVYDGLRIATLLIALGAANSLADAKRMLKSLPAALYEIGVAVTVALTVAPQLIESGQRIRRARTLRGGHRPGIARGVVIPVLDDALDRSLVLASAMDARGYGRRGSVRSSTRRLTGALLLTGVFGVTVGTYGLLDGTTPRWLGGPCLVVGCLLAVVGLRTAGHRIQRSVYRPDPWRIEEWLVVGSGVAAAAIMFLATEVDAANLFPSLQPLQWPSIGLLPAVAAGVAGLAGVVAPPVPVTNSLSPPTVETAGDADDVELVGAR